MTITFTGAGLRMRAKLPHPDAEHVEVATPCSADGCWSKSIRGNGQNRTETQYDEVEDAVCAECGQLRGRIHVKLDTIFGRDEDARVLFGRCRVY